MRPTVLVLGAAALFAALSCDSPTGSGGPNAAARLDVVSGDDQKGTVGAELRDPLVVRVTDDRGRPVRGQVVNFRVLSGGGSVFAGTALTNADGEARERWTLGTSAADSQRVEARAVDPATGEGRVFARFRATATPGAPAQIVPAGPAQHTGTAGHALADSLAARVADSYGNPVPSVPVVWTVRAGGGSISPATATTDSAGVARAAWTLGTRLDSAQVADAAAGVALRTSFTATAQVPLTVQIHRVDGNHQVGTVATPLRTPLRVAVRLMDGRPVQGATVTWSAAPGNGSVQPASTVTDAGGETSAEWTLGTAAGDQLATASVSGAPAATFSAFASPGPAAALAKHGGDGQQGSANAPLPAELVVRAQDAYGNPVAGVTVNWAVASGGGSVSPAQSETGTTGTAATRWTLGAATEQQTVTASSGSLQPVTFSATARAAIGISVRLPAPNSTVGDTVLVAARITSTPASITSFTASVLGVAGRQVNLTPVGGESRGSLVLAGLPAGPLTVRVRAQAVNGDTGVVDVPVVRDAAPRLQVAAPVMNTVARPQLRVDADCTDDDPDGCASVRVYAGQTLLASGTTGVHTSVSLAAHEGRAVTIEVVATDSRGQTTRVSRRVYVESSARWTEQATAGVRLLDYDAQRVLFVNEDNSVRISSGGAETVLRGPDTYPLEAGAGARGWLHSRGAVFTTGNPLHTAEVNFDWRDGTLVSLGPGAPLEVAGEWAMWTDRIGFTRIYRRDLAAGTTQVLASDAGNTGQSVAANGDVAYWNASYDIFRYRDGALARLTNDDDAAAWNVYPVTDGINVVFHRKTPCCSVGQFQTAMITADGTELVLVPWTDAGQAFPDYDANGGWVAFTRPDAAGVAQIWTRSPAGTIRQATSLGTPSTLSALGSGGQVAFVNGTRLYVSVPPYTSAPVDVGSAINPVRLEWRGSQLVAFLGRSAFVVNY